MKRILFLIVVGVFLCSGSASATLVGYYSFEGNANDMSGYGHNGTINGDTTFVDGVLGQSAYFDGSGDYIQISPNFSTELTNSEFSLSTWLLMDENPVFSTSLSAPIVTNDIHQMPTRLIAGTNRVNFWAARSPSNGEGVQYMNIALDQWYHLAVTIDDSFMKYYVNGSLVDTEVFGYTEIGSWNGNFMIGGNSRLG
ncbi:MAG: LamG domain-containing protein, partial [Bacteroides sp.]|nr:LamG domain-containing protein [Bacteroides sp.]